MKKLLSLLLAAAMVLTLAACGATNADSNTADEPKNDAAADAADPVPTEETPESTGSKVLVAYFSATGHTKTIRNICKRRWTPTSTRSCLRSPTPTPIWTTTPTAAGLTGSRTTTPPVPPSPAAWTIWTGMTWCSSAIPSGGDRHRRSSLPFWRAMTSPAKPSSPSVPPAAAALTEASAALNRWLLMPIGWRDSGSPPAPARRMYRAGRIAWDYKRTINIIIKGVCAV